MGLSLTLKNSLYGYDNLLSVLQAHRVFRQHHFGLPCPLTQLSRDPKHVSIGVGPLKEGPSVLGWSIGTDDEGSETPATEASGTYARAELTSFPLVGPLSLQICNALSSLL